MKKTALLLSILINSLSLYAMNARTPRRNNGERAVIVLRPDGGAVIRTLQDDPASKELQLEFAQNLVLTTTHLQQRTYDTTVIKDFLKATTTGDVDLDALGVTQQMAELTKVLIAMAVEQEQAEPGSVPQLAALRQRK